MAANLATRGLGGRSLVTGGVGGNAGNPPAYAELDAIEAADTLSATARLAIAAALSVSDSADTLSATAALRVAAVLSVTDSADTLSATAAIQIVGAGSGIDDLDTLDAAATVKYAGPQSVLRDLLAAALDPLEYVEIAGGVPARLPSGGFWAMDFPGGFEEPTSAGAKTFRAVGVGQAHYFGPIGRGAGDAEAVASAITSTLLGARAVVPGRSGRGVYVDTVDPPFFGDGSTRGRYFRSTVAFEYWYDNHV